MFDIHRAISASTMRPPSDMDMSYCLNSSFQCLPSVLHQVHDGDGTMTCAISSTVATTRRFYNLILTFAGRAQVLVCRSEFHHSSCKPSRRGRFTSSILELSDLGQARDL